MNESTLRDIMTRGIISCNLDTSFEELVNIFDFHGLDFIAVVNDDGAIVGTIDMSIMFKVLSKEGKKAFDKKARDLIRGDFIKVFAGTTMDQFKKMMLKNGIKHVIVIDGEERPVGMVTRLNLLMFLLTKY